MLNHVVEHVLAHALFYVILVPIAGYIVSIYSGFGLKQYAAVHPVRFFLFWFTVGVTCVISFMWYRGKKEIGRLTEIIEHTGVRGFHWHDDDRTLKADDWKSCATAIESENPVELCILGLTGWDTFGKPGAPLHDVLKRYAGNINILLLDPNTQAFKNRATALNINEQNYREQVLDSLKFCKDLKGKGKSIEVRLYKRTPIWKMIQTNSFLWLQYYHPNKHVDDTPVYALFADGAHNSLIFPFRDSFKRRWVGSAAGAQAL